MPTYEYECAKCKKSFEISQSMKDSAFKICPKTHCRMKTWGKGKVKRKIGAGAGFIFKGTGFYITDYRSEGYKSAAKSETSSKETKSDSPKKESTSTAKESTSPAKESTPTAAPAKKETTKKPATD
jgi:putative FmdB family regulatory protein